MSDRLSGIFLFVLVVWYGFVAWGIESSFFSDPVGSRAFPLGIAIFLAPLALYLLFRSTSDTTVWPARNTWPSLLIALAAFVAYALMLQPLGFFLATIIAFTVLALVFGAQPGRALVASVVATVALYGLFSWALDLYLPMGDLFERWWG
jgi:putative tricarboxylic transport membrane protein